MHWRDFSSFDTSGVSCIACLEGFPPQVPFGPPADQLIGRPARERFTKLYHFCQMAFQSLVKEFTIGQKDVGPELSLGGGHSSHVPKRSRGRDVIFNGNGPGKN